MDDASARKAALEIALRVSGEPESLLEALRQMNRLLHDIQDVPEDLRTLIWRAEALTDDIPNRRVGQLWEPNALAEQWKGRDEYLTRVGPELLACFRKLAEHLSRLPESKSPIEGELL
jgi:hypothetical protein